MHWYWRHLSTKLDYMEQAEESEHSEECVSLTKQIMKSKIQLAILYRKKRLLIEEIHRQFLEGELDPKKRMKTLCTKNKKIKV